MSTVTQNLRHTWFWCNKWSSIIKMICLHFHIYVYMDEFNVFPGLHFFIFMIKGINYEINIDNIVVQLQSLFIEKPIIFLCRACRATPGNRTLQLLRGFAKTTELSKFHNHYWNAWHWAFCSFILSNY
jgi:hypothetical protein